MSTMTSTFAAAMFCRAQRLSSKLQAAAPTQRHIKLIADMLDDHQRTEPHHADLCPLCIEANAVLTAAGSA